MRGVTTNVITGGEKQGDRHSQLTAVEAIAPFEPNLIFCELLLQACIFTMHELIYMICIYRFNRFVTLLLSVGRAETIASGFAQKACLQREPFSFPISLTVLNRDDSQA